MSVNLLFSVNHVRMTDSSQYSLDTSKVRIYILCYDEKSRKQAEKSFAACDWAEILEMPSTKYLENWMYSTWFPENRSKWEHFDFVGTLSWKALNKISMPNFSKIQTQMKNKKADMFAFYPHSMRKQPNALLTQARANHPLFKDIWVAWLQQLGHDESASTQPGTPAFFGNYWMATPQWLNKYIDFFQKAQHVLDTYEPIQEKLWSNSLYTSSMTVECQQKIFNRPYYPYHCFLCERLPCFFFYNEGAYIVFP